MYSDIFNRLNLLVDGKKCQNSFYYCSQPRLMVCIVTIGASLVAQLVKNLPAMQETLVQLLSGKIFWRRIGYPRQYSWASLVAQLVKK